MKTLLLSSLILLGISCSKDKDADLVNSTLPIIAVTNIFEGQTFTSGQTIPITGTVKDDNSLSTVHIKVSNSSSGVVLMQKQLTPSGTEMAFNESITASAGVTYKIEVIAEDEAGNLTVLTVNVSGV